MCFRSQGLSMPVRDSYLLSSSSLSLRRFGNEQVLDAQKLRVEKRNLFGTLTRPRGHHDLSYDMLNMRLRLPKAPFWLINDHDNNIHINGPLENYQRHLKEKDQDCRPLLCPQKSIEKTTRQFTKPQSLRPNHVQNTEKSEKFRSIHRTQSDVVSERATSTLCSSYVNPAIEYCLKALYGCPSPLFQESTAVKGDISQIVLEVNISELTDSDIFLSGQDRLTNIALFEDFAHVGSKYLFVEAFIQSHMLLVDIDNPVDQYTSANLQNQSIHAALRSAAQQVLSSFRAEVITNQQCFVNNYVPNQTLLQLSHAVKGLKFELDLITGICRHYLEFIKNERRATTLRNRGFINFLFKQSIASELCTSPKIRPRFVKKEKLSFRDFGLFHGTFIASIKPIVQSISRWIYLGEAIDIHFLEKRCLNRSRGWVFPFLRGTRVARDVFERAAFVCNVSIDEQHFAIAELSAFKDSLPLCFSRVAKHVMSSGCLLNVLRVSDQKFYAKMCLMKETQTAISHLEIKLRSTEIDALRRKNDIMNKEQIVLRDKIIPLPPSLNRTSNSQTKIVNFDIERANKEEPSRPEIIECNEESRKLDTTDCSQFVRNQNNKRQGIITSQDEVKTRQKSLAKATLEEAYEELFRDADHRASSAKWRNLRLDRIPVAKHELIQLEETDKRLYQNMNVDNAGVNGGIGTEEHGKSQDTTSCETQSTPQKNDIEVHEKEKDVTESMTDGVLSMTKFHHSQNYVRTENSKSVSTPPTFKSQQIRKDAFVSGKLASEEKEGNRADGCDNVPNSCLMSESYDMTHTSNLQVGSARSVHNNTVVQHKLSCDISAPLKSDVINTKEISPTKDISLKMKEERKLTAHAPDRVDSIPLRSSSAKKESTTDNKGSHERESQKDTHKEWTTEILGRLGASSCRSPSLREHELYSSQHLRPLNGTYSSCLLPQNSYYGFVDSTYKSFTNDLIQSEPRHNDLKSMERLDEDVPIEVAFQSCLIDPIMRQCAMVENLTALYFVYSVKVFDHISYLRSTMLGINYLQEMVIAFGDLKKASMQLSCISLKGPNILQLVENVHNTCATLSNARHHDKCNLYFSYHMSPNARKENESNHNRSKFSFQFDFVAKYQPPKPLNLIIDNSSMLLYNSIQQVLLRHLEANHLMSTLW
eukprot:CAMPEP_0194367310 /NCGR_PEP_ID=MMETSP0174-20130528/15378_1 /TAXON_ID=216777 /ORGANISM="Proboscia alata, Strain PI-D3" /LENGTH=1155 /DNA_ID=CAMNT_0039142973 /DNA_START=948 /DNA_END=4412 /DNA_ORIENTATION=-